MCAAVGSAPEWHETIHRYRRRAANGSLPVADGPGGQMVSRGSGFQRHAPGAVSFKINSMKKGIIALLLLFSLPVFAQRKHSKQTSYPTYNGLIMAGYQ